MSSMNVKDKVDIKILYIPLKVYGEGEEFQYYLYLRAEHTVIKNKEKKKNKREAGCHPECFLTNVSLERLTKVECVARK